MKKQTKKQVKEAVDALIEYKRKEAKLKPQPKKICIPKTYTAMYQAQVKLLEGTEKKVHSLIGQKVKVIYQHSLSPIQVLGKTGKIVRVIQDVNGYRVYEVAFNIKLPSYSLLTGKPVLTFSDTDVELVTK